MFTKLTKLTFPPSRTQSSPAKKKGELKFDGSTFEGFAIVLTLRLPTPFLIDPVF